ncbi:MAG: hypothetical protein JNN03_04100 [Rubrivivax sp.]|nr:hypothetical protein [Rubrivivax sp.]
MRPTPDAAAWARLSTLFDTGCELPPELRHAWLATLVDDEPLATVDWLRDMLATVDLTDGETGLEHGPMLPAWSEPEGEAGRTVGTTAAPAVAAVPDPLPGVEQVRDAESPGDEITIDSTAGVGDGPRGAGSEPEPAAPPAAPPATTAETEPLPPRPATEIAGAPSEAIAETAPAHTLDEAAASARQTSSNALHGPEPAAAQDLRQETAPEGSEEGPEAPADDPALPEPEPEPVPRLLAPALATGMRLGPWLLLGPMPSSDARVEQWRARRADQPPPAPELALLVPRQWRPRVDLAAWLAHASARATALVHPHIARLTEVGVTEEGTPWFAAELAEGQTIDRWCRDHPLGLQERRALLEQALEAATFAHGRLVLHGQVHPSQIVLTPGGRLRFLNFGLSELLDLLDAPHPGASHGVAGPPVRAYGAPEVQRDGGDTGEVAGAPIATGDIYALGLVAFEVLSGASPWQPRTPGTTVVAAPGSRWPRPSDFAHVPRLRRALRGDLDAIVTKATQTDPADRYASAAELLDDVRRVGMHRPVTAVEGGFLYQIGCLVRRHRRLATVAVLGAAAFLVFLGALSWKAWVWSTEREQAEGVRRGSEAVTRLLRDQLFEAATPGVSRDWPEVLARTEAVARSSLGQRPQDLAAALALIGRERAESGAFAEARNLLAEALPNLVDPTAALEATCDEAWAQARQGDKPDEAEQRIRRVTENVSVRHATRALCLVRLADLERRSGRARDAHGSTFRAWQQWDATPDKPLQLAVLLARPAGMQSAALGFFHEGQAWFESALKRLDLLQQGQGPIAIELREQWGELSLAAGDGERALKLADENLAAVAGSPMPADADPATAAPALLFLAAAEPRLDLHQLVDARARLERAIGLADAREDPVMRQRARCAMAVAALRERDTAAAERWLKSAAPEVPARTGRFASSPVSGPSASAPGGPAIRGTSNVGFLPVIVVGAAPATQGDEAHDSVRTALREADHACRATAIELALHQGRYVEAQREADRLIGAGNELAPRLRAVANLLRAEATLAAQQYDRSISAGLQALQQARALHQSDIEEQKARPSFRSGQAALVLAEAHRANGDIAEARKTLDYAMQQLSATLPESHPWRRRAEATKAALAVHATKKP